MSSDMFPRKHLAPEKGRDSMLISQRLLVEKRLGENFSFYDPESKFCLDMHGMSTYDNPEALAKAFEPSIQRARNMIKLVESGGIANKTAVKEDSENLAVDHFNHRMKDSPVEGKNLEHTLKIWEECVDFVKQLESGEITAEGGKRFTDVIFNGIGGSYLGPYMMLHALRGRPSKAFPTPTKWGVHFLANTDPDQFHNLMESLPLETTILVTMSKSGSTKETFGNMLAFRDIMAAKGFDCGKHSAVITVAGSNLDKQAEREHFLRRFHMCQQTGGRTSVISAIGMLPCAFGGVDFAEFARGMSHMDELTRREEIMENPAFIMAMGIEQQRRIRGRQNMVYLTYSAALLELPHYLQQLYMESLGKEYDIDGCPNPEGLTLFGGVGTGEQHAFMQQIQKGIGDAMVRFTYFRHRSTDYPLKEMPPYGTTMGRQLLAFEKGTEAALMANGRDFITTVYDDLNAFSLGMMVALEERVVMVLGAIRRINTFDQPGVQDGKVCAKDFEVLAFRVEEAISKRKSGETISGTVFSMAEELGLAKEDGTIDNIWMLDAILMDVCNNWKVSWDIKLSNASFTYDHGKFVYTITIA